MWLIVVAAVLGILLLAEYLSRYRGVHSELTRKLVHIAVGVFVAFWPFFLSWGQIELLSLAFLVVIVISVKFNIFSAIHAVKRNAAGEVLFALVIGLLAFITSEAWVFTAAMLHLGIADGLAAIVGLAFGKRVYKVFGHNKSVVGSLTFLVCSVVIMIVYGTAGNGGLSIFTLAFLPVLATALENLAVRGTDNLIIPLFVALALSSV